MAKAKEEKTADPKGQDPENTTPDAAEDHDPKGQDSEPKGKEPAKNRDAKGQKKEKDPLLCLFFGPECKPEIADDGTMTRGAETFAAVAEGDKMPEGEWQQLAARSQAILLRKKLK